MLPAGLPVPGPQFIPGFAAVPDETVLIDPKTRGVRNVGVWLRPDNEDAKSKLAADEIHPDDGKRPVRSHVIAVTPKQVFAPRIVAARPGDLEAVENRSGQNANFVWDSVNNGGINVLIPPGRVMPPRAPLVAEVLPIPFKSLVIPIGGTVRVFEHPYYAVTDADGRFELKNAPVGKYRLVYRHEKVGYKGGAAGRRGERVEIAAGTDGTMALPAVGFDVR